jgi:hypothetical protein
MIMSTDADRRIADLERRVRDLETKLADVARYLKRAEDSNVQTAGRRAS